VPPSDACRLLTPEDAPAVVALFRAVFGPVWTADTIYAAPGAARWIARLLELPWLEKDHVFVGMTGEEGLEGFMEFREVGQTWHANHLAVGPHAQGRGLARTMIEFGWSIGLERGLRHQSLDVDPANSKVAAWHERNGFRTTAVREVRHDPLPEEADPSFLDVEIMDWPVACANQEIYGFSMFTIHHDGKDHRIGRLAEDRFRILGEVPEAVRRTLARMAPGGVLVNIREVDAKTLPGEGSYLVHRMERTA
jgi:GNAT superfamily N-acetyltransferase